MQRGFRTCLEAVEQADTSLRLHRQPPAHKISAQALAGWMDAVRRRPSFPHLSFSSALYRIHQILLPRTFSQTPVALARFVRGVSNPGEPSGTNYPE